MHYAGVTDCRLRGVWNSRSLMNWDTSQKIPTYTQHYTSTKYRKKATNLSTEQAASIFSSLKDQLFCFSLTPILTPMSNETRFKGWARAIYVNNGDGGWCHQWWMLIMRDGPTFINGMVPASRGSGWIHLIYKHFHATKKHFLVNKNYILLFGASWVQLNKKETRFKGWLHVNVKSPIELSDSRLDR